MFSSIYMYRVPRENFEAFLRVQREAAVIYQEYGALGDETFAPANLKPKYGCIAFPAAFEVKEGEELLISLSRFRDRAHHDEIMKLVDADDRIDRLYEQVTRLVEVDRVVRGEFERVV
jgi:uncharacterized protein YbaA (DUF1428 family)